MNLHSSVDFTGQSWVNLTWSSWALPMMSEVICPSIPGSLLWFINHVPGMDIWDKTGLVGTAASWDWSSGSAGLRDAALSSGAASPGTLVAPEPLFRSNLSTRYSWGPPSVSTGLRSAPADPQLPAPSSEFGVAVPEWFLLMEGVPCPRSGMDFSPTWQRPDRFLPRLKQELCYLNFCSQRCPNGTHDEH